MALKFRLVRGMRDLLPEDSARRRYVRETIREMFRLYRYREVETPTIEYYDFLAAKAGDEIRHRMYAFEDLGGRKVALRPEMTAPVARLFASKLISEPKPLRLGYIANCFRYDNPQMGRYREFYQAGFELFGSSRPEADAETLTIAVDLMERLGFRDFRVKVGHVGILRGILAQEGVDEELQNRLFGLVDKNKLEQAFDQLRESKVSQGCLHKLKQLFKIKGKPSGEIWMEAERLLKDYPDGQAALENLEEILSLTQDGGLKADFHLELGFARGLEYYTGMIFEIFIPKLNIALNGGGRYDRLIKLYGGPDTAAVGCAPGIDRIVLAMEKQQGFPEPSPSKKVMVIPVNGELRAKSIQLTNNLRKAGIEAEMEISGKNVKKALSAASSQDFSHVILVGPEEAARGNVILKDMRDGKQSELSMKETVEKILKS